jgi:aminopeptidase
MTLIETAARNLKDVLSQAIEYVPNKQAVVVFDTYSELSTLLSEAYRSALPKATFVDFETATPEEILKIFDQLTAGDLVVLVQSMSFRLNEFRIRVELFKNGLKVIEHPHLARMRGTDIPVYVDSLAYDPGYYRVLGPKLKLLIDQAQSAVVDSGGTLLRYDSTFEDAKLNIGDYTGMKNVGGQFPIGEVFTEPKNLDGVNGEVKIFAFGDTSFAVNVPEQPITLIIERARVVGVRDSTPEFDKVLEQIKADEEVWVRELGFGMNRAFSRERRVLDIGTYERMCGIHLSLGAKHSIYAKPGLKRREGHYHVDVFAVTNKVLLDDTVVYADREWKVGKM